uniref:Agglutinin domain-containing protein n=1 Tax=Cucumis melo TaxID=3656 RepID=A0A9I9CC37_CUCME
MFPLPPPKGAPAPETPKKEAIKSYKLDLSSSSDDRSIIPKYFALQNYSPRHPQPITAPFLQNIHGSGYLEFNSEHGLLSPISKFESEISDSDSKLIHIRCTNNNRYWVRKSSDSNHIVPTATKKEDDRSKWSCTLFEPICDAKYKAYRFRHVQLGYELFRDKTNRLSAIENGRPDSEREDAYGVFTKVIDWNSLCVFPKHVTFKGFNGRYLRFEGKYLQVSGVDNHPSLIHEIFPQKDGNLHLKNVESRRFWIYDPNWIVATARVFSKLNI